MRPSTKSRHGSTKSRRRCKHGSPNRRLARRIAAAEAQTKALGDSLAALNRRLDDIAVTAQNARARADAASAAAEAAKSTAQTGVQRGDLDALAEPHRRARTRGQDALR